MILLPIAATVAAFAICWGYVSATVAYQRTTPENYRSWDLRAQGRRRNRIVFTGAAAFLLITIAIWTVGA